MQLEINDRQDAVKLSERDVRRILEPGLEMEGLDAELSVALVGDEEIKRLNRRFLGRERITDVLAFPYEKTDRRVEGEIVVNGELAAREAAERSHGAEDELALYLVHGLLHLVGYDDHSQQDARRMRRREQEVLRAAGRVAGF